MKIIMHCVGSKNNNLSKYHAWLYSISETKASFGAFIFLVASLSRNSMRHRMNARLGSIGRFRESRESFCLTRMSKFRANFQMEIWGLEYTSILFEKNPLWFISRRHHFENKLLPINHGFSDTKQHYLFWSFIILPKKFHLRKFFFFLARTTSILVRITHWNWPWKLFVEQ